MNKWDERFLKLAAGIAEWSKDRSTKVGAVAVGPDREIRLEGYNGFPRGVDDDEDYRHERPTKYLFTAHAEENVVAHAARVGVSLKGCTLYIASFPAVLPPCATCARLMVQAGIARVVYRKPGVVPVQWKDNCDAAAEILNEGGVVVDELEVQE